MSINVYLLRPPKYRVLRRVVLNDRKILERGHVRVVISSGGE